MSMISRIDPIESSESDDEEVNEILQESQTGWYKDSVYFGVVAHQARLLSAITLRIHPSGSDRRGVHDA